MATANLLDYEYQYNVKEIDYSEIQQIEVFKLFFVQMSLTFNVWRTLFYTL